MQIPKQKINSLLFLKKNKNGQVAIFVALIFQILFVFFAMVINVGLLIHHKINLQNSADLAAYYGAMKQAEVLNAMAHVNYQIRQSWKLFSWRYRVFGTYAHKLPNNPTETIHPGVIAFSTSETPNMATFTGLNNNRNAESRDAEPLWHQRPLFCISHQGLSGWPKENLCKVDRNTVASGEAFQVRNPSQIPIAGGHIGTNVSTSVNDAIVSLAVKSQELCTASRRMNYAVAGTMLFGFQADQAIRKVTFKKLYETLIEASQDAGSAKDLNNESMAEGTFKTLINNLTEPNRKSIGDNWNSPKGNSEYEVSFGLGDPACENFSSGASDSSAFTSHDIFPDVFFLSSTCSKASGENQTYIPAHLSKFDNSDDNCSSATDPVLQYACKIKDLVYASQSELQMSLGYSKNPKCLPYTGIKVSTTPKIPFMPTEIKLTARSYAQAFGGSIGPQWNKKYLETAAATNQPSQVESGLSPILVSGNSSITGSISNSTEGANFAKYPGDQFGLGSDSVLSHYSAALSDPTVRKPTLDSWKHIIQNNFEDMMIQNNDLFRKLELTAVVPNLFDITYYSIEPNFFNLYYTKIIRRIGQKVSISAMNGEFDIRPDLGSKKENQGYTNYSIKDQLSEITEIINRPLTNLNTTLANAFPWMVTNQGNVLTSWNFSKFGDYMNNPKDSDFWKNYIGVCWENADRNKQVDNTYLTDSEIEPSTQSTKAPTTGNCITGGRTGFSIRLINEKLLTETFKAKLPTGWE